MLGSSRTHFLSQRIYTCCILKILYAQTILINNNFDQWVSMICGSIAFGASSIAYGVLVLYTTEHGLKISRFFQNFFVAFFLSKSKN